MPNSLPKYVFAPFALFLAVSAFAEGLRPSDTLLGDLASGNARFRSGQFRQNTPATEVRNPSAVVLSCSDSRIPPEAIFDQGIGAIYTVRVAGNSVGSESMASIEYAVEKLGARMIIILGHESCDAIRAAAESPLGKSAGSPDLDALVAAIKPNISRRDPAGVPDPTSKNFYRELSIQNVDAVADRILKRSRIVRKRVLAGNLRIIHAIYGADTGKVDFWAGASSDGAPLLQSSR